MLRLWDRDALLGAEFPMQLRLRGPTSAALSERFDEVRAWVAELQQGSIKGYRLVLRDVRHRIFGSNSLPAEAWVDTQGDALRLAGKVHEGRAFAELLANTRQRQPALVPWLHQRTLHCWGDIDTHSFAILDQLRARFPHALSFLTDRDTLLAHQDQWVTEPQPTQRDLPLLGSDERRLYDELRWWRLREEPVRLGQERIAYTSVEQAVAAP